MSCRGGVTARPSADGRERTAILGLERFGSVALEPYWSECVYRLATSRRRPSSSASAATMIEPLMIDW